MAAAAADYGCLFKGRSVLQKFGGAAERLGDYVPTSIHKHKIHHTCYKFSMSAPFRHFASFILEIALAIPDLAPITRPFPPPRRDHHRCCYSTLLARCALARCRGTSLERRCGRGCRHSLRVHRWQTLN